MRPATERLLALFHRRWNAPILAELASADGAKFVTLVHKLGASEGAVRSSLEDLIGRGWVMTNPGYGHPLRPEYVLTAEGARLGGPCGELRSRLRTEPQRDAALRRWCMPALFVAGNAHREPAEGVRFGELAGGLDLSGTGSADGSVVTDRALSMALKALGRGGLISRRVIDAAPPVPIYAPSASGRRLLPVLEALA